MRRLVAVLFALALISWTSLDAAPKAPPLWAGLQPGAYAVGFRTVYVQRPAAGPQSSVPSIQIGTWYPAARQSTPMSFGDYLELGAFEKGYGGVTAAERDRAVSDFVEFLKSANVSVATAEGFANATMYAVRDAEPVAAKRFSLVYLAQGNGESMPDLAVWSEFLASHGYVVISTPSVMRLSRSPISETMIGALSEKQAGDIALAIACAALWPNVAAKAPALIGYSFGARAALLYAMRHPVSALVSLDGGIGSSNGVASMKSAWMFDGNAQLPPILHVYEENDPRMAPDLTLLRSLKTADLELMKMPSMRHVHFSTTGFASVRYPDLAQATSAGPGLADDLLTIARKALDFLSRSR